MLRDLTIQNYRSFKNFHVEDLARVNLIVGMNNSGKTSLLEAVYLLVNQGLLQCLIELLNNRGELAIERSTRLIGEAALSRSYQVTHIFYGHQLNPERTIHIYSQKDHSLSFQIQPHQVLQQLKLFEDFEEESEADFSTFELKFIYGKDLEIEIPVRRDGSIKMPRTSRLTRLSQADSLAGNSNQSLFLTTSNFSFEQLAVLWDVITLTPKEESIVAALKILEPAVERISFTSRQTSNSGILLKLHEQRYPIPLGSMGDGMRRILTLVMAAVTVENGFLLVDEIDTGLHYQTQADMWRLVLEVAQQLNIQIFATTHSWDCISAFQEALTQVEDSSVGKLWRLSRRGEEIRAVEYTAEDLSTAVHQSIEVR